MDDALLMQEIYCQQQLLHDASGLILCELFEGSETGHQCATGLILQNQVEVGVALVDLVQLQDVLALLQDPMHSDFVIQLSCTRLIV